MCVTTSPLTLSSMDSLCMSWLMGAVVCGWYGWFMKPTESLFFSDSSLDLKGTKASWLTVGMAASSSKDATLSWLVNSTKA